MAEKSVLVVGDEATAAGLLSDVVKDCGLEAEVAQDGQQALESMRAHVPDLVLLDLTTPGMSGDKALATMETEPELQSVPVIVISTSTDPIRGVEREVPRLGKPCEPSEVQRLIVEMLNGDGTDR
jgi:CheY-like chemotaxis protein